MGQQLDLEGPIGGPAGSLIGDNHSSDSNEEEAHSRPPLSIRSGRMDEFASVTVAVMTPAGLAVGVVSYGVVSFGVSFRRSVRPAACRHHPPSCSGEMT